MSVEVDEEATVDPLEYARVPIAFEVRRAFDPVPQDSCLEGYALSERELDSPYTKDYGAIDGPREWMRFYDISTWRFFAARLNGMRVGGATIAFNTPGLTMLENRRDIAVLWDIRVSTEVRRQGVGSALFRAAEAWAETKGHRQSLWATPRHSEPR